MIQLIQGAMAAAVAMLGAPDPSVPSANEPPYLIAGAPNAGGGPSFHAIIAANALRLQSPTSAGWYRIPLPLLPVAARPAPAGTTRLSITPGRCSFARFRARYPDAVSLEWDGGRFAGCGGPRPPAQTAGAVWELVRIGNVQAPNSRSPAATLTLGRDGSLGGSLNCNNGGLERRRWLPNGRFSGRSGHFVQTAMGCFDAGETFGRRFWTAMETAQSWRREGERLFIRFANGNEAELHYLIPASSSQQAD